MLRRWLFLPILLAAVTVVALLTALGPERLEDERMPLLLDVRVQAVHLGTHRVIVTADGTARPARRTSLAARAAGEVIWAADDLREGVRIEKDALLFRIRPTAYEQALSQAKSRLAEAELRVLSEQASAEVARSEWGDVGLDPHPLALGIPQLHAAEEAEKAARTAVRRAEEDLRNTEVRAPHDGIVASRGAEVGEWVTPGLPLAELLSVELAEVRVSLPDTALPLLDLPFGGRAGPSPRARVIATLGPPAAESRWIWEGRLTRMEGELDPATRFFPAVIEVPRPYATGADGRPPLVAGMFVQVEIEGKEFAGIAAVPRSAFRADGRVLVVDDQDRVRIREVDAFWPAGEAILVRSGLADGERLVESPPSIVADGMRVRVVGSGGPRAPTAGPSLPGGDR